MKINVCIGSSCHLKGSRQVAQKLQELIKEHHLENQVSLCGRFCMDTCEKGVIVQTNHIQLSLNENNVETMFNEYILPVILKENL